VAAGARGGLRKGEGRADVAHGGKFFDPALPTELLTDASRLKGLGYALIQRDESGMRLIKCGSRSLSPAETRYATIELEALAIHWAIASCRFYLMGGPEVQGGDGPQAAHPHVHDAVGRRRERQGPAVPREDDAAELRGGLVARQEPRDRRRACPGPRYSTRRRRRRPHVCAVKAEDPILQDLYDAAEEDESIRR
jgi:hypothetical protein